MIPATAPSPGFRTPMPTDQIDGFGRLDEHPDGPSLVDYVTGRCAGPHHAARNRALSPLLELRPGQRVLEVGCGTGVVARETSARLKLGPWVTHPWVEEGQRRVRFGVMGGPLNDWPRLRDFVRQAEELGFDSYWAFDHPVGNADWATTLAALAVSTTRIRLGTLVSCVYYRSPVLLARQAADVDRLSGGRMVLGLAMGDAAPEFAQLGVPFPPVPERQAMLDDAVRVIRGVWGGSPFTLEGAHVRVRDAMLRPGPVQQPRMPLLIAGAGERVTLRQVAEHADVSNFGEHAATGAVGTPAEARRKLAALDRHLAAAGRPPESVLRSHIALPCLLAETAVGLEAKVAALPEGGFRSRLAAMRATPRAEWVGFVGTPAEAVAYFRERRDAGLRYFVARVLQDDTDTLRLLASQVISEVA